MSGFQNSEHAVASYSYQVRAYHDCIRGSLGIDEEFNAIILIIPPWYRGGMIAIKHAKSS